MDIAIRPARPGEHAAAGEISARAYLADDLLAFGPEDPYLDRLRDAAGRAATAELLVAVPRQPDTAAPERAPEVLGTVTFAAEGPFAQVARPDEAEFRMLAVAPAARGRGIGESLVRYCAERAAGLGRRALVLSIADNNERGARLYRRMGFHAEPSRDWQPVPGLTLRVLVLPLTSGGGR
ncbi:GNAT family N-acetyltransferase [Streptomyces calidiresistens]|uniref:GNAT family N-acetyltransferase n=1 Tax=Streptomyces calidiresistens TaxID=1485586 RepID=A0A7W3T137_9ACTN|nr:GNAT family N-acetyltransferase [Streptomyces calidiresistens]MBB0228963.1 GNAT family N-acetyltransferase [Streptomyces calidiresistens]